MRGSGSALAFGKARHGDLDGAPIMISVPSGVRVWLAGGVTDMRRGMNG